MAIESIADPDVKAVFDAFAPRVRAPLLKLRGHIVTTAARTPGVGALTETLKWREPAYLPATPRTGTTIRINAVKGSDDHYGAYFHCQTTLVQTFWTLYPDTFTYQGNRAILFSVDQPPPVAPLHCACVDLPPVSPRVTASAPHGDEFRQVRQEVDRAVQKNAQGQAAGAGPQHAEQDCNRREGRHREGGDLQRIG